MELCSVFCTATSSDVIRDIFIHFAKQWVHFSYPRIYKQILVLLKLLQYFSIDENDC